MHTDPFHLSLETVIAASSLLGHSLEERAAIRQAQDQALVDYWQHHSTLDLRHASQQDLFCVAPLDILVADTAGDKQFHLLELNGTGIGGLTNLQSDAVASILDGMTHMALNHKPSNAVILVASSGKESDESPRLNRLIYEKLLFADALKRGFELSGQSPTVAVMPQLLRDPAPLATDGPTVVVGYIKEFLDSLRLESDGGLSLFGRTVTGAVNDRFCLNVIDHFDGQADFSRLDTMNRCFLAGGDKAVAYGLLNEHLGTRQGRHCLSGVDFDIASCHEELVETVLHWRRQGRQAVIKPHATGLGHGIEFFLSADESQVSVLERIDRSVLLTQQYYGIPGGAFPYTICPYVDACTIARPDHPLFGHKYELRVVVYRDGMSLRAFPSIVKIASQPFDPQCLDGSGLINNITASSVRTRSQGTDYMLPLSNRRTLDLLGLTEDHVAALCATATGYVRHVLDQVQDQPERFGLPAVQTARLQAAAA